MRIAWIIIGILIVLLIIGAVLAFRGRTPSPVESTPLPTPSPTISQLQSGGIGGDISIGHGQGFQPQTLSVAKGSDVKWANDDNIAHTVTSDTGLFDSGSISPDGSFEFVFQNSGTYFYHCSIHAGETGSIVVQ